MKDRGEIPGLFLYKNKKVRDILRFVLTSSPVRVREESKMKL